MTPSHCITCGDEGVAMRVISTDTVSAICADPGQELHEVAVELVAPLMPGDLLLVHAGVAIGRLEAAA